MSSVTVVIPTHLPRLSGGWTRRAVASVFSQTRPADALIVELDVNKEGSAVTRNRGLAKVTTEWVAFLDSDDQFKANHLERLLATAEETGADVVYSAPEWVGRDPVALRFGLPFDADALRQANYIPVTSLVRTELAWKSGGFTCPPGTVFDDWGFYLALLDLGAEFVHLPERTWVWNFHGSNTAGQAHAW